MQDFALQTIVSWLYRNKHEFLAGIAVSLTMVPTSVAFAFLAELSPQVSCDSISAFNSNTSRCSVLG
jgi:MFS superfamily sulfate permease-like transporter